MDIIKEHETNEQQPFPLGLPGTTAKYYYTQKKDVLQTTVRTLILTLGKVEETSKKKYQWLNLQAKKTNEDDLDDVALGRVFTGKRASELKLTLVDKLGGLHEAIEVAKNSAEIEGEVDIIEYPRKAKAKKMLEKILDAKLEKQISTLLPEAIRSDWEYLRSIEGLMDENTLMILPYKIDIE